jgi:hypothetical protein
MERSQSRDESYSQMHPLTSFKGGGGLAFLGKDLTGH